MKTYVTQLNVKYYSIAFIIRKNEGYNPAVDLALGRSKFYLKLTVKNAVAFDVPPVEEGQGKVTDTKVSIDNAVVARVKVIERRYGINLSDDDMADYKQYSDYITQTYAIFGGQYQMQAAYRGDYKKNISAEQVCADIAKSNGWLPQMDMTLESNKILDEQFSPYSLKERVAMTYKYSAARAKLCSESLFKINRIYELIKEHTGKRIMILSTTGAFADTVYNGVNIIAGKTICLPFHNDIPTTTKGKTAKGTPKKYGCVAASKDNLAEYHSRRVAALSAKGGSIFKEIPFMADVVIITSPLACSFTDIVKRCSDSTFGDENGVIVCKILANDTIEENVVLRQNDSPDYEVFNCVKRSKINDSEAIILE
jgi:hypothetical protein